MKKILSIFVLVGSLAALGYADRQYQTCDPVKSSFCSGLASLYEFEEASDFVRTSETAGVSLIEPDGADVANSATHKTGTYSLDHAAVANSYVYVSRSMGPTGSFSTSFWLYVTTNPSANTKRVQILSTRDSLGAEGYPRVYLYNTSGTTRVRYEVRQGITDAITYVENTQALSTSTWYHIMFGQNANPDFSTSKPYQQAIWLSVNANTKAMANITYPDVTTVGDFIVGGWRNTSPDEYGAYKIDQLATWIGIFSPADITRLYNSGSGRAFPFVD